MAQKHILYAELSRGHATQTVADGRVRCTRREGPIHISVTRGHASTRCAGNSGDRSKCDADSVTDERVCPLQRQSTDAVPRVPQHSRSQRAGTWCRHASEHHRPGLERVPGCFARASSSME
ncbi:exo-alpha-sialidase, partial [Trypanosoma cruzi]